MKLNKQEFFIGMASSFGVWFLIGNVIDIIIVSVGCGFLWTIGGAGDKWVRRFLIPMFISNVVIGFEWWHLIAVAAGIAILHMGDGFPDFRPGTADNGSWLGRFIFNNYVRKNYYDQADLDMAGLFTKCLIPVIFQLSLIPYWFNR